MNYTPKNIKELKIGQTVWIWDRCGDLKRGEIVEINSKFCSLTKEKLIKPEITVDVSGTWYSGLLLEDIRILEPEHYYNSKYDVKRYHQ